jgi:hypothetical protein
LTGTDTIDARFTGAHATAEYNRIFGRNETSVPVENDPQYGEGTRLSHWRESVFDNELMTGIDDGAANRLSAITIASLADLGYQVNMSAAETYTPPAAQMIGRAADLALASVSNWRWS